MFEVKRFQSSLLFLKNCKKESERKREIESVMRREGESRERERKSEVGKRRRK